MQVHAEVMRAAHVAVHHEAHRQFGALAGLDRHRTDDGRGWSTALHDFDKGRLGQP